MPGETYSMPVPSGPHSHFWPAAAYRSQPSSPTSTGSAPTPCAPSSSTGTSSSASAAGATEPGTHETCEQATSRVAGPTASATASSGTIRTFAPPMSCAACSGPSRPGCSSSLVTISSPGPSCRPATAIEIASVADVVRATSAGSQPSRPAYAARSAVVSWRRRSKWAVKRPSEACRSSSARRRAMSTPRRIWRRLLAADRPLAGARTREQHLGAAHLLGHRGLRGVSVPADAVPGVLRELEHASVGAAPTDGAGVPVRLALGDAPEKGRDADGGRATVGGQRGPVHLPVDAAVAGQGRRQGRGAGLIGFAGVGGQRDPDRRRDGDGRDGGQGQLGRSLHANDVLLSPWGG